MIASASITITHLSDGLTTHYEYAKNESNITAPSVGWSPTVPASEVGKFIWRREGQALAGDTPSTWSTPVCLTGVDGIGILEVVEYYALSDVSTEVNILSNTDFSDGKTGWTSQKETWDITGGIATLHNGGSIYQGLTSEYLPKQTVTVVVKVKGTGKLIVRWGGTTSSGVDVTQDWDIYHTTLTVEGNNNLIIESSVDGVLEIDWIKAVENITATNYWVPNVPATITEWQEEPMTPTAELPFLWNYEKIFYTDGSFEETLKRIIGVHGDKGLPGSKGDPGAAGAVGQGVESIIEEYYLSTSKTAQTGGSWVTDPPTWSTGKYMWTRSKITYKNPTDTEYTTPVCDSSWEAVNLTEDELKKYIQSRGENLVTNGSGLLGSNYNFSAFTYDGSEAYYSNGSFRYYGSGTKFTDEFMPVNPELPYKLSMFAKTANGVGRYYAMVVCFDVDNQEITAKHHMYRANTLTTLSQELKNGDTVVHLTDASNWYNDGTAGVSTHLRSIILWNYKNSYGYLYPPQTYSRNWIGNAWNPGAINFENNTITLISPWAGGTVEAGTPLSNGSSGSTYKYCAMSNTIIPTTWTEYAGVISGIDLSGSNVSDKFPPGTAKVKIGWLLNYQGSGETIWIANLAFNIHLATQSELDSTKLIVNSSVKSTDVEYYLSTSSTSLSGGSWQTTAPAWVDGKFMWSRTRVELNNGTVRYTPSESGTCIAGATGATGPQGPHGNPGAIGVNTDGATIMVSGFDDEGVFGNPTGTVYLGSSRFSLNETTYTVTTSGHGYILASASGAIQFAKLKTESDGSSSSNRMAWKEFNTGVEIVADAVIGEFHVENLLVTKAEVVPPLSTERFIRANFMEILRNAPVDDNELKGMAMAMGADRVFQTIVAIEAFIKSLWVSRLESEIYTTDAQGYPDVGFHLDGIAGIAKIASLVAKNADIVGSFKSDGFQTLSVVEGTTVGTYTVPSTIFKFSEMCELIPDSDDRVDLAGTIEGYTFTKATRRVNKRVRLYDGGPYSRTMNAGDKRFYQQHQPTTLFGTNYFVQWHCSYSGQMSNRCLARTIPGQTATQAFQQWVDEDRRYEDMKLWYGNSGTYSGNYSITAERPIISLFYYSTALWGSVSASSNYLRVWTNSTYNGLVLTNGDTTFNVVGFQPDAYYLSSSKAFTIGSTNQDSTSVKKYKSGTDFYNRFSAVPVGTNSACSGVIRVNGTSYTVTRMRKDEDRITFYTGTQEVVIRKFVNGTSTGVYTDLAITTAVVLGKVDGGIESMWIVPWAHALYDIGQITKRFRSMYLSGEMVSGSVQTGTISATTVDATTVNATTVYGARFN
jgi:hypothetical protein